MAKAVVEEAKGDCAMEAVEAGYSAEVEDVGFLMGVVEADYYLVEVAVHM